MPRCSWTAPEGTGAPLNEEMPVKPSAASGLPTLSNAVAITAIGGIGEGDRIQRIGDVDRHVWPSRSGC